MKFAHGHLLEAVNSAFSNAAPGLAPQGEGAPVMTTPATVVATPEDVALATATLNATAAVVNATAKANGN